MLLIQLLLKLHQPSILQLGRPVKIAFSFGLLRLNASAFEFLLYGAYTLDRLLFPYPDGLQFIPLHGQLGDVTVYLFKAPLRCLILLLHDCLLLYLQLG